MGEYYEIVCHDCKVSWSPRFKKLWEIERNVKQLAEFGLFLVAHRHHRVDVIGDDGDGCGCDIDTSDYLELGNFDMPSIDDSNLRVCIKERDMPDKAVSGGG
jgi:hypothetical protein